MIEIEMKVIGAWLTRVHQDMVYNMRPEWFTDLKHKEIFLTIRTMYDANEFIDSITVMRKNKDWALTIAGCMNVYVGEHIGRYIALLHQEYIRRDAIKTLSAMAYDLPNSADIIQDLATLSNKINEWQLNESGSEIELQKLLNERYEDLEKRSKQEIKTIGKQSGFAGLDKYIGGFVAGENIVVAGRPGMGKTAFAVSIGIAHALRGGKVIMYSMEMSKEQLADRILSMCGEVDNLKIRNAEVNEYELNSILTGLQSLQIDFMIEDTTAINIDQIKARIKAMEKKPTLVIIDYMQLVKSVGGRNREQEIAHISRQCKLIAKECGCTVMPLSQLNRGTEEGNSRPKLSNLRESGAIEQDADTVLFPYRPDYYEAQKNGTNPPEVEEAELIISKCRNGMTGTLPVRFRGKTVEYLF